MDQGIYTQASGDGTVHTVQVLDSAGNRRPMEPATYRARGLQPPIETLRDIADYTGQ